MSKSTLQVMPNIGASALAAQGAGSANVSPGQFQDDGEALAHWLAIYDLRNASTARSYRSQVRKFQLFLELAKPLENPSTLLKKATEMDVALYESAVTHTPLPSGQGIRVTCPPEIIKALGLKSCPFSKPLKRSSVNLSMAILHAMYEFFRKPPGTEMMPYRVSNPCGRVIRRKGRVIQQTDRYIPIEGIRALRKAAALRVQEQWTQKTASRLVAARTQFALDLLFGMWGRRNEITHIRVCDLKQDFNGGWHVDLARKGGKTERIPIADWVMKSLFAYRAAAGLAQELAHDDVTPLLVNHQHKASIASVQHLGISNEVLYKDIRVLASYCAANLDDIAGAVDMPSGMIEPFRRLLMRISPHWFRHSGASIAINQAKMSTSLVSKMLGHTSESTTSGMYYHADSDMTRTGIENLGGLVSMQS